MQKKKEKKINFELYESGYGQKQYSTVLEMAGRQVAKCDQKSFGATSFGQKDVYLSPKELCLGDQL